MAARLIAPDWLVGSLAAVLIITSAIGQAHRVSEWIPTGLAAVACGAAITVRRRSPLGGLIISAITLLVCHLLGGRADVEDVWLVAMVLLVYNAAARTPWPEAVVSLVVAEGVALTLQTLEAGFDPAPSLVLLAPAFVVGRALRRWRLLTAALAERAAELDASREAYAALAVRDERLRIARELHDVVGHAVSLIVIQASAGQRVAASRPESALAALDAIDQAGAQALEELSTLAVVLEAAPRSVQDLVQSATRAGLEIHLEDGGCATLAPLAFRVVQESLTNVIKHAGPTGVTVTIQTRIDDLEIRITDDGPAGKPSSAAAQITSGGLGLTGMRDRVVLAGGTLTAGPRPRSGWEVHARIPHPARAPAPHQPPVTGVLTVS